MTERAAAVGERIAHQPITFGLLIGTRGFFNPAHAATARKDLLSKLDTLGETLGRERCFGRDMMRYITREGFEHHVAMARGHFAPVLEEAIDTYLDWELYVHEGD
ncbi:MAG: hypothetical protein ACLFPW_13515 [Spirochaetaceae bacterium]